MGLLEWKAYAEAHVRVRVDQFTGTHPDTTGGGLLAHLRSLADEYNLRTIDGDIAWDPAAVEISERWSQRQ